MTQAAIPADPVDAIAAVNGGRDPRLLRRKFDAMAAEPFVFLRATAMVAHAALDAQALPSPVGWVCGDLHLQNFGCFRGANRLVYFDLNDFDEAARLPLAVDLLRLLSSILAAAPGLGLAREPARELAVHALAGYAAALVRGKAFWLERDTARGPIRDLLEQVATRRRRSLLAHRTELHGARRVFRIDGQRYLALPPQRGLRERLEAALHGLSILYERPAYFQSRDFARRVAGMGSLGVARYVALVRGRGDPDKNALIDFKQACASSAVAALPAWPQPPWADEAQRVVLVQDICQAACPAYLTAMPIDGRACVVRELQPVEDRIGLEHLARQPQRLATTISEMAAVAAFAHLRGAGRRGAAEADMLIDFGRQLIERPRPWLDGARRADAANTAAFRAFRAAWRRKDARLARLCEVGDR
jgi:uncharacterized protein (DUF2252 family)